MAEDGEVVSGNRQRTAHQYRNGPRHRANHAGRGPAPLRMTGRFRATVVIGWILLIVAAIIYVRHARVPIPTAVAIPLAIAFLVEYPFYLIPGFPGARDGLMSFGKSQAAGVLAASAIVPWLIYAL